MADPSARPDLSQTYDSSDEEAVKQRKISVARREKEDREVIGTLLSSPAGRNWMWNIMAACHVFETILPGDAAQMAYPLGERNVGLRLLAAVTSAAPEMLIQMMKERGNA